MRNRIFAVLAIAVLAGGGLAYGTYNLMSNQPVKTVATPTQPVVVATADLPLGTELDKDDLKTLSFPSGQAPEGSFAKSEEIIGRGLIVSVVKGEPILAAKLASKEAGAGLPPVIPEGMRAVSVRVNEVIGVAGYVLPGSHVDVVTTQSPTNSATDTMSKVVLANVLVLTAGTRIEQDQTDGKPVQVTVVTMASRQSRPSASRSRAPKERFSSRCVTRSIRVRPPRRGFGRPCCWDSRRAPRRRSAKHGSRVRP
jgi:pilus assembly protein CpaB